MCGIAGFADFNGKGSLQDVQAMADALLHRGPDDSGYEVFNIESCRIGFGFRRLSIIDLSAAGHQPMHSEHVSLIFNGELYNHQEVRKSLEKQGCRFKSGSDTEVFLQAYLIFGISCIEHFRGMFAIALLDRKKQCLYLIRDRAGVKPLFWYHHQQTFLFASELKAFHRHPSFKKEMNHAALSLYFQHGYIPVPHCIFNHTRKLLPGHFLQINLTNGRTDEVCYWDVTTFYNQPKLNISFEDAITETERLLQESCNYRMVADVPVGIFLSGGYDSSLVTALIQKKQTQKLKTFTIGFEDAAYNESEFARQVATHLQTDHHEFTCTYKEAMDIIPLLPELADEPLADSSIIPTYLVSKMARQQVTVALSADGGDETFAGYTKYAKAAGYLSKLKKLSALKLPAQLPVWLWNAFPHSIANPDRANKLLLLLQSAHPVEAFNIITQAMTKKEVRQLLNVKAEFPLTAFDQFDKLNAHELLDNFLWLDYKTFLADDILAKVDRATMAVSLEGREPLLDHKLTEWAVQLPASFKLKGRTGKYILRHITHKHIPASIMEREKMGFQVPLQLWMRTELSEFTHNLLSKTTIDSYGLFNYKSVVALKERYFSCFDMDFNRLWKIIVLQQWCQRWMN
ncbi:MAG: asparagine synthase (glutamine-hydrolyzing) [Bacteroidia bacterium]|nr:asparagine synthase (glutamine-hydrolyzing) [Bacteroidia bacterium]MCZ2277414.1 asparagine synthase (glutamine-hydrolyzing) [Bacteroidia bacterium]